MSRIDTHQSSKLTLAEGAAAATPASGLVHLYAKTDGLLYSKDDAGAETLVSGGSGNITTDAAWAAKGDLIVGTGNDTAAILTVGANGSSIRAASGTATGQEWQLNNLAASVAPAVTDDVDLGYTVGSRWIDTTADKEYVCLDNTDGAAVWTETTGGGAGDAVATDAIWDAAGDLAVGSGANTAAKLTKGAAGGVLAMGNSAVIWNAGTSFPASKATGDRYWRTDLGMEFFWDGAQWVTTQLFVAQLGTNRSDASATASVVMGRISTTHPEFSGLWLCDFHVGYYLGATNDGSKYWDLKLRTITTAIGVSTIATISTSADTASQAYSKSTVIDALLGAPKVLDFEAAKVSTPTGLNAGASVSYRGVAT